MRLNCSATNLVGNNWHDTATLHFSQWPHRASQASQILDVIIPEWRWLWRWWYVGATVHFQAQCGSVSDNWNKRQEFHTIKIIFHNKHIVLSSWFLISWFLIHSFVSLSQESQDTHTLTGINWATHWLGVDCLILSWCLSVSQSQVITSRISLGPCGLVCKYSIHVFNWKKDWLTGTSRPPLFVGSS